MVKRSLLLDSGAFSAKYSGGEVHLDEYIEFYHAHKHHFKAGAFNMDVIGDGQLSYDNWHELKRNGVNAIPVYHIGTDEYYLKKYLDECDHISIGGIAKYVISKHKLIKGLDRLTKEYLYTDGRKDQFTHKVHGLGITSWEMVKRYPWDSVDSSVSSKQAGFGTILMPDLRKETPDYSILIGMALSDQSRKTSRFFYNQSELLKRRIVNFYDELGLIIDQNIEREQTLTRKQSKAWHEQCQLIEMALQVQTGGLWTFDAMFDEVGKKFTGADLQGVLGILKKKYGYSFVNVRGVGYRRTDANPNKTRLPEHRFADHRNFMEGYPIPKTFKDVTKRSYSLGVAKPKTNERTDNEYDDNNLTRSFKARRKANLIVLNLATTKLNYPTKLYHVAASALDFLQIDEAAEHTNLPFYGLTSYYMLKTRADTMAFLEEGK